ncbi:MAG: hypothetical protein OXM58_02640 [Rhodospirillaceae bacterium]|nr:hypothetical protein [Rhodospirillaceae bacterium]MDE0618155.1 hypothetical protein [Rhodospirillaceae bacterium]
MRVGTGISRARSGIFTALAGALLATIAVTASATEAVAQTQAQRLKLLEQTVKELLARDEARERKMKAMEAELKRLRGGRGLATVAPGEKPAAKDDDGHGHGKKPETDKDAKMAGKSDGHGHAHGDEAGEDSSEEAGHGPAEVWSARVGDGVLRLKRLGLDVDFAMGAGTAKGEDMEALFGGHHDPQRTGFTLQGVDLSAAGSFDPYFDAFFNVNFTVDGGGETAIELEEAWARTKWLAGGVRLQAGHFYAPFGIVNRTHIHDWAWQTRPIAATRVFGADGARGLGGQFEARLSNAGAWNSSVLVSMQNRRSIHLHGHGEEEEGVPDHTHADPNDGGGVVRDEDDHDDEHEAGTDANGLEDFAYTLRMENRLTISPQTTLAFGGSAMFEPNPDGSESRAATFGADVAISHRLPSKNRIALRAEYLHRNAKAAEHHEDEDNGDEEEELIRVQDYGFYVQGMWYTPDGWGLGLRYERVGSRGGEAEERAEDPMRGNRTRISPLLLWQFSELGRLKLQYNFDDTQFLEDRYAHSVFMSVSWSFGLGAPDHAGHAH